MSSSMEIPGGAHSSSRRRRVLVLSFTNPLSDPRVFRQIKALSADFDVTVAGLPPGPEGMDFIQVEKCAASPLKKAFWALALLCGCSGPFLSRYALRDTASFAGRFDLVLVNDADPLPLAFDLAKGAPVFFDAHEYYPKEFEDSFLWSLLFKAHYVKLCREFIPRCAGMSAVSEGIAKAYAEEFGASPLLVLNAPSYEERSPSENEGSVRLIHHGASNPERHLELMVEMMDFTDGRFTLDFMLVGKPFHLDELRRLAAHNPRIKFVEPVPMPEITAAISGYDMGVFLLPPVSFNYANALPNKFFEFLQARLGIAVGPTPEMAALVERHGLGVVSQDFSPKSLAMKLNALSQEDIARFKANSGKAASLLNAETELGKLGSSLKKILEGKDS